MILSRPGLLRCSSCFRRCTVDRRTVHDSESAQMHAVIGRVKIKPDRADEAFSMIAERGAAMLAAHARVGGRLLGADSRRRHHSAFLLALRHGGKRASGRGNLQRAPPCPMRRRPSSASTSARSSGRFDCSAQSSEVEVWSNRRSCERLASGESGGGSLFSPLRLPLPLRPCREPSRSRWARKTRFALAESRSRPGFAQ